MIPFKKWVFSVFYWAIPGLFFVLVFSTQLTVHNILPMNGFEPRTSSIGSDRSANWATTTKRSLLNQFSYSSSTIFEMKLTMLGSGCGSVGRAVASDTFGMQFVSSHWQNLYWTFVYSQLYWKTKKGKEAGNWPFLKLTTTPLLKLQIIDQCFFQKWAKPGLFLFIFVLFTFQFK